MARVANIPTAKVEKLNGTEYTGVTVASIADLAKAGRPKSVDELEERITQFFSKCAEGRLRPGIETMCLAIGCDRSTFWLWCKGSGCSEEWANSCRAARQATIAFLEQASLTGNLNPASSIFLLKNWASYKDSYSFEDVTASMPDEARQMSRAEMLKGLDALPSRTDIVND